MIPIIGGDRFSSVRAIKTLVKVKLQVLELLVSRIPKKEIKGKMSDL